MDTWVANRRWMDFLRSIFGNWRPPPSRPCLHKHLVLRAQSYDSIDFKTEYIKKGRIFWHAIFWGFLTGGSPHLSREWWAPLPILIDFQRWSPGLWYHCDRPWDGCAAWTGTQRGWKTLFPGTTTLSDHLASPVDVGLATAILAPCTSRQSMCLSWCMSPTPEHPQYDILWSSVRSPVYF